DESDMGALDVLLNGITSQLDTSLKAVLDTYTQRFPVAVANSTERNTIFPSPKQGDRVFRKDLGYTETYYAAYNSSTNPGGMGTAGWYPPTRLFNVEGGNSQTYSPGWAVISSAYGTPSVNHLGTWSAGGLTLGRPGLYRISATLEYDTAPDRGAVQITKNSTTPDGANTALAATVASGAIALNAIAVHQFAN